MLSLVLAAALALMAETSTTTATEGQTGSTTVSAVVTQPPAKPQKICRKETPMGSRLPVKVCRTVADDAQMRADSQDATRQMQTNTTPPPTR